MWSFKTSSSYSKGFPKRAADKVKSQPFKPSQNHPSQKFEQRGFPRCHVGQFNWTSLCWMWNDFKMWQDPQRDAECHLQLRLEQPQGAQLESQCLPPNRKITICPCEAWKHLARCVTTGAAEFCAPLHFQTSLKESHLDCDIKAWLRTAGSSLKKVKKSLESFISWSNANIFHLCITPT